MGELATVVAAARRALDLGETPVLATVVQVAGSAFRRPGAHMLVSEAGRQAGSVSGGCLERDIVRRGAWLTAHGPVVLTYDSSDDQDGGFSLGCGGIVRIFLERPKRGQPVDWIAFVEDRLACRRPGAAVTVIDGSGAPGRLLFADGAVSAHDLPDAALVPACRELAIQAMAERKSSTRVIAAAGRKAEVFAEYLGVSPPLVIFGAGHDTEPLVRFAQALGFRVTLVAPHPGQAWPASRALADSFQICPPELLEDRVPLTADSITLVMTHSLAADRRILAFLLGSPARYIGVLGPRSRTAELLAGMEGSLASNRLGRLYAPAGLDLGAEGPEGVALSILAEIQALLSGHGGRHLRERAGPIHD